MSRQIFIILACLVLSLRAVPASADVEFWPTTAEFLTWPGYCQARFVTVSVRGGVEYARLIPKETVDRWSTTLGRPFVFIHHHCFGLIWLQRAMLATDPQQRDYDLRTARNESMFTFERVAATHPIYAEIATQLGTLARVQKDYPEATKYFEVAMQTQPTFPGGYQGKALVLQDLGDWTGARDILLKGDAATGGESSEINYFLGLTLVHLKDYDSARTYAVRAYELGYPLPGLRHKLAAAGHPLD